MSTPDLAPLPIWIRPALRAAAIYNLAWGAWVVLAPGWSLQVCGLPDPLAYPQLWQCIGMMVGVYGVGYWIAASNPIRHWAIIVVGLLGKVLGPAGFLWGWWQGTLPVSAGRIILFNDLIWWGPFAAILWHVLRQEHGDAAQQSPGLALETAVRDIRSNQGASLAELSAAAPLLVVFLRHSGCTFCREALSDLQQSRRQIEAAGVHLALVHMSDDADAAEFFARYGLEDVPRFSDPQQVLYQAFDLGLGRFRQLMGLKVLWRGFQTAILHHHGFSTVRENGLRMPGTFLLHHGKIVAAHRYQTAADRPDYAALACSLPNRTDRPTQ